MDALDILPPEVEDDHGGEGGGKVIGARFREVDGVAQVAANVVHKAGQVLAGGDGADGPGQNIVKKQGRNRDLGQGSAHGFLDHAVHAATHKHGAGLNVESPHRVAEQHDSENEPGGA